MKQSLTLEADELREVLPGDQRSLLALRLALAARGDFDYLCVGADLGESVGPRGVQELTIGLCVIETHETDADVLRRARFCRQVINDHGVIVFEDRTRIEGSIVKFLGELTRYRAYPLAHDLFVVEMNVPSLLSDPRVKAQVPRRSWLLAVRLRVVRLVLRFARMVRPLESALAHTALAVASPRRSRFRAPRQRRHHEVRFEIHTFVNDEKLYAQMRESFIEAGFRSDEFVSLNDGSDDPYAAITRIGGTSQARYPILCHQDVRVDHGAGADELLAAVHNLDTIDPHWVLAGTAGITQRGRTVRQLVDPADGFTGDPLPVPVVTLDENFLVFNGSNPPRCSRGLWGFHLYGTDACLNALASGGSAYVIDFPITHLSSGDVESDAYQYAKDRFAEVWNERCLFRYLVMPTGTLVLSRSRVLRRLFGSGSVVDWVGHALRD